MLVLVLGMASLASAVTYTASSAAPFTITITSSDVSDNADVLIDWTNYVAVMGSGSEMACVLTGSAADIANLFVFHASNTDEGVDAYYGALAKTSGTWANGATLATFDLNGAGANTGETPITMNLLDGDLNVLGTVTVMVPEPATIALLCLGGLLLRKKK
ncbi:MAG: PEP-CTERM sorting domain-containing protein [Sedimentisphaerales bacterium]